MTKDTSEPRDGLSAASRAQAPAFLDRERVTHCYRHVKALLLAERNSRGHWEGELSTSALSTATAIMALEMVRRGRADRKAGTDSRQQLEPLIDRGLRWVAAHQNADGGWGDTRQSFSNISTTMLCHA